jgi:F0F1-type ATP synthase assembly protein I
MLRERRAIDPEDKKAKRLAADAYTLGLEIVACIGIPGFVAHLLDQKFKTTWFLYIGLVIGIGAAIKALLRFTRQSQRTFTDKPDDDARPPPH